MNDIIKIFSKSIQMVFLFFFNQFYPLQLTTIIIEILLQPACFILIKITL